MAKALTKTLLLLHHKKNNRKLLKPGTVDMIRKDMARDRQSQRTQSVSKDRTAIDGKRTKASDNLFAFWKTWRLMIL